MSRFQDVSFLITGGARGIGRELVRVFVGEGAFVTFADLHEEAAAETMELVGAPDRVRFVAADIGSAERQ